MNLIFRPALRLHCGYVWDCNDIVTRFVVHEASLGCIFAVSTQRHWTFFKVCSFVGTP